MDRSKTGILRLLTIVSLLLLIALPGCKVLPDDGVPGEGFESSELPLPKALTDPLEIELNDQIQEAVQGREDVLAFIVFRVVIDHVDLSEDGRLALVWIALVDRESGLVQPGEPGLVIARREVENQPWLLTFQVDADFAEILASVPDGMLSAEDRQRYLPAIQKEQKGEAIFRGYRLPWTNGETVRLTGSIGHVYTYKSCPADCLYAFDFANGSMFPVRAARMGTVKYAVWDKPNGNTTNANYIVLEDTSTVPTTFQVYLHLAQDSIPPALRQAGAKVVQGQFIGNADDTGYSTGNHLHFHVHTNKEGYWGKSVDIVFDEVTVNGGRPRKCSEADAFPEFGDECMPNDRYVSRNGDTEPPTGGITDPVAFSTITTPQLNLTGWMKDDVAVLGGQLIYKAGGDWIAVGDALTVSPFTIQMDLCQANIPDGPFAVSLAVQDQAGRLSDIDGAAVELVKNYACTPLPPVCEPGDAQVAVYAETGFKGQCQVLDVGKYPDLDELDQVKSDQVNSIEVGVAVSALLYTDKHYDGLQELFQNGDADLSDNLVGAANAASLKVVERLQPPVPPTVSLPEVITPATELTITWTTVEGVDTRASLTGAGGYANSFDWQSGGEWSVGTLQEGDYNLVVEALNLAGTTSASQSFKVTPVVPPPATHMESLPPISNSTAILLTWVVDSGADGIERFDLQWREGSGGWQKWEEPIGALTRQLVFWGKPVKSYEFRIRAVDLIGNEEPFTEVAEALTMVNPGCSEDGFEGTEVGDDEFATAAPMEPGATQLHSWCPAGDVDWVIFQGEQGEELELAVKPLSLGAEPVLQLYQSDGVTLIGETRSTTLLDEGKLAFSVPSSGIYAVKLSPVDQRISGIDAQYEFRIDRKSRVNPGVLVCGSAAVPALLGGAYAAKKVIQKKKPKGVGYYSK